MRARTVVNVVPSKIHRWVVLKTQGVRHPTTPPRLPHEEEEEEEKNKCVSQNSFVFAMIFKNILRSEKRVPPV